MSAWIKLYPIFLYSSSKTYKVLLIGETYAGKTALAIRLVEDRFSTEQVIHTVGELSREMWDILWITFIRFVSRIRHVWERHNDRKRSVENSNMVCRQLNTTCCLTSLLPLYTVRDTAGSESYDSITTQYYRGGAVSNSYHNGLPLHC